ncbi:hypothetical protein P691DRAFT_678133 [Macrolepiota fuliginosa MF-IS2]|uniref:Uncharacterized protein n=1 Tax=Macrolepiota fuliginosa MF-IS2 TaxID=1400762 RepID=A0A9P5X3Z1_9AGAR|nr:hypothetical protein P691DRAFT_678133 [Macrolepiota fuliginosa MF-IS2]
MDNNHLSPAEELKLGLPPDAEARVIKEARKEGLFAGLTGGLASGKHIIYGLNRNKTIFCGILSGVLSGYLFTQAFTSTAVAQLRAEQARQRKDLEQVPEIEAAIHPSSSPNPK